MISSFSHTPQNILEPLYGGYSVVGARIGRKFELFQAFMHILVKCKNEKDRIQNEGPRVVTTFLSL